MKFVAAALLAVAASWMLAGSAAGQAAGVKVVVNGVDVPLAVPAVVFNGQVMAPIAGLFEPMGAIAAFYETDRSIVVTNRVRTTVVFWLNETAALVNGQPRSLPVAPALLGSQVFVPVQATFALLGAWARFDETDRAVFVNSQITGITPQVSAGALQVAVDATGPMQVETNVISNPDRLVVDFINATLRTQERLYAVSDAGVDRIRTAQFQVKPYVSRMVFDLNQPVEVSITTAPTSYLVTLQVRPKGSAPWQAPEGASKGSPLGRSANPVKVTGVSFQPDGQAGRITVDSTGSMDYKIREFMFPDRLAIDVQNAVFIPVKREISVDGTSVVAVRAAQFTARPPVTRIVVTLKRKLNYIINQSAGRLTIDLSTNTAARGHLVAIDPGHGGEDPGAVGPSGLREADVVLDIALRVRDLLAHDGIRVLMIRDSDTTVDLADRPRVARESGSTIYVSIHANASPRAAVNGTETFFLTPQSLVLAQMIQDELGVVLGIPSRGIKTANFVVLRDNDIPSVLVETAFISHADDELRLRDQAFRQHVAEAVHHGIVRFLAIYPVPQQAP
ncbi:MAG: AMIN domain-containing protein [Bacillati bacterium ANGP1]|uniref:AMIN domain-containing protein n=1 Tax=Candidatus Segetimicrobium genomatis TaxID=2569760 RepID=A0A537LFE9_9BACT|nr:MAG: AMIN domain-containing protein [Terrabacteria group bacterium ANGP1]